MLVIEPFLFDIRNLSAFMFAFQGYECDFFLSSDDSAEFNLVNNALLSIFKMDAKGKGHIFL